MEKYSLIGIRNWCDESHLKKKVVQYKWVSIRLLHNFNYEQVLIICLRFVSFRFVSSRDHSARVNLAI